MTNKTKTQIKQDKYNARQAAKAAKPQKVLPPKKKCVEIVHTAIEGGQTSKTKNHLVCHELFMNDENGFSGLFEDNDVKYTSTFKLVDGKVHYSYKYDENSVEKLKQCVNGEWVISHSDRTQIEPNVLDIDFAVYDLEYTIAAAALNFKLKCQPIVDTLKKMYPKYNLAA